MSRRLFIVFNPSAGRHRRELLEEVVVKARQFGASVAVDETAAAADASSDIRAAVASGRWDVIVAAGGDGTVRLVASAVSGSGVAVGYIPLGTGNVLAHELNLPRDADGLARNLVFGTIGQVEIATANDALFVLMAGMGFDGRVVGALDSKAKAVLGKAAYIIPTVKALGTEPDEMTVTVDGCRHIANWAVIANGQHYAGRFVIAPRTDLRRPGLSAILFKARWQGDMVAHLVELGLGKLGQLAERAGSGVTMLPCRHAVVESAIPLPVQIDGDAAGAMTRLEIKAGLEPVRFVGV